MTFTRRSLGQRENPSALNHVAPEPSARVDGLEAVPFHEVAPPEEWSAESPEGLVQTRSLHSIAWRLNPNSGSGYERHPERGPFEAVRTHPAGAGALVALSTCAGRFHLGADASRRNSIETLSALVAEHRTRDRQLLVLFVDYLQKVEPAQHDLPEEAERVARVVQGLTQLALDLPEPD
jgi:hypothetical protein